MPRVPCVGFASPAIPPPCLPSASGRRSLPGPRRDWPGVSHGAGVARFREWPRVSARRCCSPGGCCWCCCCRHNCVLTDAAPAPHPQSRGPFEAPPLGNDTRFSWECVSSAFPAVSLPSCVHPDFLPCCCRSCADCCCCCCCCWWWWWWCCWWWCCWWWCCCRWFRLPLGLPPGLARPASPFCPRTRVVYLSSIHLSRSPGVVVPFRPPPRPTTLSRRFHIHTYACAHD